VAKLVPYRACLLRQLSGFESRHLSKILNGRQKQRSGQHTVAHQKVYNKNARIIPILTEVLWGAGFVKNKNLNYCTSLQRASTETETPIITINVPVVNMAREVMTLMRAISITRPLEGVSPEIDSFLAMKWQRGPRNGYCPHQNHYVPSHINKRYINTVVIMCLHQCSGSGSGRIGIIVPDPGRIGIQGLPIRIYFNQMKS
jgi:hypothetical protein